MKAKIFDCVEMKHQGAAVIQKQLESKSREQQLRYWQEGTEVLKRLQKKLRNEADNLQL